MADTNKLKHTSGTTSLPPHAQAVIIGGGVVGCFVAYHMAELGWTDIVLLERKTLTCGTITWTDSCRHACI